MKGYLVCKKLLYKNIYRKHDFIETDDIHTIKKIDIARVSSKSFFIEKHPYAKETASYSFYETLPEARKGMLCYFRQQAEDIRKESDRLFNKAERFDRYAKHLEEEIKNGS